MAHGAQGSGSTRDSANSYISLSAVSDLGKHSRVPSRPQSPESCTGEGRRAVFTGTDLNHNVCLLGTSWASVNHHPRTGKVIWQIFASRWTKVWGRRRTRIVWSGFRLMSSVKAFLRYWLITGLQSRSPEWSIICIILFSSVSFSNSSLTLSPTVWVPGSSSTAGSCSKPRAAKSCTASCSMTSCCWHRWRTASSHV